MLAVSTDSICGKIRSALRKRDAIIDNRIEQIRLLRHKAYGTSSEQAPGQGHLFDEAEILAAEPVEEEPQDVLAPEASSAKRRGKMAPVTAALPPQVLPKSNASANTAAVVAANGITHLACWAHPPRSRRARPAVPMWH